jgi:hypothetical protein
MTPQRLEEIYTEYIGNGQFGIDFEKKHILEAMQVCARECCVEQKRICARHFPDSINEYHRKKILHSKLPEGLNKPLNQEDKK